METYRSFPNLPSITTPLPVTLAQRQQFQSAMARVFRLLLRCEPSILAKATSTWPPQMLLLQCSHRKAPATSQICLGYIQTITMYRAIDYAKKPSQTYRHAGYSVAQATCQLMVSAECKVYFPPRKPYHGHHGAQNEIVPTHDIV